MKIANVKLLALVNHSAACTVVWKDLFFVYKSLRFSFFQSAGARASGMAAFGPPAQEDADPFPLRWGEVIPLHFLTSSLPASTRFMVLSQPSRRYTDSVAMIPELLKLGEAISK